MVTPKNAPTQSREISETVLLAWGSPLLLEGRLGNSVWRVRQGDRSLALKKRPASFSPEFECSLLGALSSRGVPAAIAIQTATGQNAHSFGGSHWSLYPLQPGRSVSLGTITSPEAAALGAILAVTHNALDSFDGGAHLPQLTLSSDLGECHVGLIHRDFHARNVLLEAGRVTAVLDFDLACRGPRAFDLAYLGASLLADAWQDLASRERFFPVLADITHGYAAQRHLEAREISTIQPLMEEAEKMFEHHGRACGNTGMERGAAEVRAWLERRRAAMAQALGRIVT